MSFSRDWSLLITCRDNLLGISWVDSTWIPILNSGSVLDYFSERSNPFYDRTCNNEVVKMQRLTLEHLNQMVGVEYILLHAQEPILFIIRKQQRQSPTQVIPLADYYIIAGVIYQAPDLGSVINSRVLTAVHGIQSAFDEAMSYCRYHPSKGYWWHFKDHEEQDKVKPKAKRKEEPSSIFQRQRVDALLLDLRQKFPPRFVQQKSGEKPVPVDQTKKEAEPVPEAVKSEEKETTKNVQQTVSTKAPSEKRMRLQYTGPALGVSVSFSSSNASFVSSPSFVHLSIPDDFSSDTSRETTCSNLEEASSGLISHKQRNHMLKFGRNLQWFDFISKVIHLQHATQTPVAGVQCGHGPRNPFQPWKRVL
ncbi:mediator of RNA polymerase II transcription subunit 6 isoform X2 [Elephas maximus indicus]|uniref:mediator of RNA polymerase II transcription subunit 6 isoform X2 n=1 Tax=Elephas maximus indicus TaxID=99487 RepID=UPI002115D84B|nr:mediator of RNA polymerase II transcription subunit 6 isoform X2 [Elephas maximus indicus]